MVGLLGLIRQLRGSDSQLSEPNKRHLKANRERFGLKPAHSSHEFNPGEEGKAELAQSSARFDETMLRR